MRFREAFEIFRIALSGLTGLVTFAAVLLVGWAQSMPGMSVPPSSPGGHGEHGTPPGWTFHWPKGDPVKGREVFVKLECYSCHEVKGETFPAPSEAGKVGPELSMMGPMHPPEYFAEAIINPSAVVEKGKGYEAPDGSSKMPSYNDSVTVQDVVDLVAFLTALRPPAGAPSGHGSPAGSGGQAPLNPDRQGRTMAHRGRQDLIVALVGRSPLTARGGIPIGPTR